jgi:hypothetical protein
MDQTNSQSVLKPMKSESNIKGIWMVVASFLVVTLGIGLGFFLSKGWVTKNQNSEESVTPNVKGEVGISDETNFPDTATGILVEGGVGGEGTHHLERPGGASQNVYLTSTVIDLQSFVGKKVTVWGQTLSATKAGWLMDVGKMKVSD